MKKSIFKEFKHDEIAKLANIVGGVQEQTSTTDSEGCTSPDTYTGDTTSGTDLTPSGYGDSTDWTTDVVEHVAYGGVVHHAVWHSGLNAEVHSPTGTFTVSFEPMPIV